MKLSVIIPTYNHLDDCLKPCIESIIKYTDFKDTEVIVSANGCKDNTDRYVRSLGSPFKLIWNEKPVGFPKAINDGIESSIGDYVILLNNDTVLLPQQKNTWINILLEPFSDEKVGISGPVAVWNVPAGRRFLIFFCTAIKREVINKIGLLDLIFSPGGCEDVDYSVKAEDAGFKVVQVPNQNAVGFGKGMFVGNFPIYHKGQATIRDKNCEKDFQKIQDRNSHILATRYNHQWKLGNNWERAVFDGKEPIPPREHLRYQWAKDNVLGKKVLDIGCSSGYGWRYLKDIAGMEYLGIDKDVAVIEFAKKNFGDRFAVADIDTFEFGQYDTIVAFEILEHLTYGKELAQKLKKHCKCLLATTPYKEEPGFWGPHHKLHRLKEDDFPDFEYQYINTTGIISRTPDNIKGMNLMLMKWIKNGVKIEA